MKKILLIVLVLIVGCAKEPAKALAKEPEPINLEAMNERDDDYYTINSNLEADPDEPYTGAVFSLYKSGEKESEGYLKNGKEMGVEGIKKIILNNKDVNPKNIISNIIDSLSFDQAKLRDDITCMCIKISI